MSLIKREKIGLLLVDVLRVYIGFYECELYNSSRLIFGSLWIKVYIFCGLDKCLRNRILEFLLVIFVKNIYDYGNRILKLNF